MTRDERAVLISGEARVGIEDLAVDNESPVHDVATGIFEWLGWA